MSPTPVPPHLDVTVRVGCSLAYEATGPASLLLNVKPCADRRHQVIAEALTLGDHLPFDAFTDTHGNAYHRVALARGSNYFRHDAIVAVSSKPDNHGLAGPGAAGAGVPPAGAPALHAAEPVLRLGQAHQLRLGEVRQRWSTAGPRVQAISQWIHDNIEYRYLSGRPDLSAWDILQRGYGVCRDFAHLASRSTARSTFRPAT